MLKHLNTFITVAEQAGFAKAAKKLGISNATVTRYIQDLEHEYGIPLFTRTTRHIGLTEQGESFHRYALEIIQLNDEVRTTLLQTEDVIQGHIKIGLPTSILQNFAQYQLTAIAEEHPELSIEIVQGNHINDLLSSHFDLVLHCGPLPDVNYYYENIGSWQKIVCAAPSYLKKHGEPKHIDDLGKHECLDHADNDTLCWHLMVDNKLKNTPINSRIKVNSSLILKTLAEQGLGIACLPSFTVNTSIDAKILQPILHQAWPDRLSIYALYPLRKRHNKKISMFVDAFREFLNPS